MSKMILFDPPLCCSTGVCGSSADSELLRVAAVIKSLEKAGITVERHNLSSDPKAFMQSKALGDALYQKGEDALPIIMVDEKIMKSGSYPTDEEFAKWLDVSAEAVKPAVKVKAKKCCCSDGKC